MITCLPAVCHVVPDVILNFSNNTTFPLNSLDKWKTELHPKQPAPITTASASAGKLEISNELATSLEILRQFTLLQNSVLEPRPNDFK